MSLRRSHFNHHIEPFEFFEELEPTLQNDFLDILVSAIARQEGYFAGNPRATPVIRNNRGDLRFAGQTNASRPAGERQR